MAKINYVIVDDSSELLKQLDLHKIITIVRHNGIAIVGRYTTNKSALLKVLKKAEKI